MSELNPTHPPYRMETDIIPAGVDLKLATQRNALIEKWRCGEAEALETYRALEHLYWRNQDLADDTTRGYLRETSYSFPVEANLDPDETDRIYLEVQNEY